MILTPLPLADVPRAMADFISAVEGDSLLHRIARRISASLAAVNGADISLSQDPDHHAQAVALLARFGMGTVEMPPSQGLTWDSKAVAVGMEPSVIIHEVAHFQLASPERRGLADFGLGAGPESGDKARGEADRRLHGLDCEIEEARASLLGVLWEAELGQPAVLAFLEQNWLEGGVSPRNLAHFAKVAGYLHAEGFIDDGARPQVRLRTV